MKYIFLNEKFYSDYPITSFPQLELKCNRPYIHIVVSYNNEQFALPLRSNINHPHAFLTDKKNKCGVDYSKGVRIEDKYIDNTTKPHIRNNEFKRLQGKEYRIQNEFEKYIKLYKDAKGDLSFEHREQILKHSSLQYFEDYI